MDELSPADVSRRIRNAQRRLASAETAEATRVEMAILALEEIRPKDRTAEQKLELRRLRKEVEYVHGTVLRRRDGTEIELRALRLLAGENVHDEHIE